MNKNVVRMQAAHRPGRRHWLALTLAAVLVAGCALPGGPKQPEPDPQACRPAAAGDAWVGNWLAIDKRKGVAGELHILMTLQQDGSMAYSEQLKRSGKPPQTLNETGCWQRSGETLVLRTIHSNAMAVEQGDPIYTNEYDTQTRAGQLVMQGHDSAMNFRRMPDDYRLPVF